MSDQRVTPDTYHNPALLHLHGPMGITVCGQLHDSID